MQRRARPLLGTLVEVGADGADVEAAFGAIAAVQRELSRFDAASEVARFNALPAGGSVELGVHGRTVLGAAARLAERSGGCFDVALGSGRWQLDGACLIKLDATTRLDLGGIAKGYAVDCAVQALQQGGASSGWVNAGGDLRCFGATALTLQLRDEANGGVRPFGLLRDGACATSWIGARQVSVLAPACLWADALTKVVARLGRTDWLAEFEASAWLH